MRRRYFRRYRRGGRRRRGGFKRRQLRRVGWKVTARPPCKTLDIRRDLAIQNLLADELYGREITGITQGAAINNRERQVVNITGLRLRVCLKSGRS